MIHGRFQPFHNGHLEYLRGAAARCDELFVGITNPDPWRVKEEPSDPLRHLPESNPFTYVERLLMIDAVVADEGIAAHVIPFPVNEPELWPAYVPPGVTQFLRLFSDWGGTKLERLRGAGYEVVVLDEGAEKEISGIDVRAAMRDGATWVIKTTVAWWIEVPAVDLATTPVDTWRSAHTTPPFPPASSSVPTRAADPTCRQPIGSALSPTPSFPPPRRQANTKSTAPATTNRVDAIRNGGIVRMANLIARYVEPQTT